MRVPGFQRSEIAVSCNGQQQSEFRIMQCGRREGDPYGPARPGSGGLRFRSGPGPFGSSIPSHLVLLSAAVGRRGRHGATRGCFPAAEQGRGGVQRGDGEDSHRHLASGGNSQSPSALHSRQTFPPSLPPSRSPPPGATWTLVQPRCADQLTS